MIFPFSLPNKPWGLFNTKLLQLSNSDSQKVSKLLVTAIFLLIYSQHKVNHIFLSWVSWKQQHSALSPVVLNKYHFTLNVRVYDF